MRGRRSTWMAGKDVVQDEGVIRASRQGLEEQSFTLEAIEGAAPSALRGCAHWLPSRANEGPAR